MTPMDEITARACSPVKQAVPFTLLALIFEVAGSALAQAPVPRASRLSRSGQG
jgi:hypothetical protein